MLRSRVYDILPPPFEWVEIPAGRVTLEAGGYVPEGGQTFDMPAFAIAKYPVTNAQYAKFVEAGGYNQRRWWTEAGWEAKERGIDDVDGIFVPTGNAWTQPRYPDFYADLSGTDYPVIFISWYEAAAFCLWLSEVASERISLPTDQQWQRAAQGDDGRVYPWGNEWDGKRCNNTPFGQKWINRRTSTVTQYAGKDKGDSPFGLVDMAGNVYEWCSTAYKTGSNDLQGNDDRIMRGGAWHNSWISQFRTDYRVGYKTDYAHGSIGFRIART
jgi:formylglycine-generating enzyme required for sulfatase activity